MIIKKMSPLKGGQFYPKSFDKFAIGLHHTAGGSILEAFRWWNQTPEPVGTPYGIERNGDIFQCFPDEQWAWQFGLTGVTDKEKREFEQGVVGIELSSYGWLKKEGEKFFAYPAWPNKKRKIEINCEDVIELQEPFKGEKYFHKYTEAQIKSTVELCKYLVDKFKIKVQDNLENLCDFDLDWVKEKRSGILSHTAVRATGKFDIYPDPDLIKALKQAFNNSEEPSIITYKLTKPFMKSEDLKMVQKKLQELGFYKDKVDGVFGNNTKKAIEDFQKSSKLKVTGTISIDDNNPTFNSLF